MRAAEPRRIPLIKHAKHPLRDRSLPHRFFERARGHNRQIRFLDHQQSQRIGEFVVREQRSFFQLLDFAQRKIVLEQMTLESHPSAGVVRIVASQTQPDRVVQLNGCVGSTSHQRHCRGCPGIETAGRQSSGDLRRLVPQRIQEHAAVGKENVHRSRPHGFYQSLHRIIGETNRFVGKLVRRCSMVGANESAYTSGESVS